MKGAKRSGSNKPIDEQFLIAMTEAMLQQGKGDHGVVEEYDF